MPAPEWTRVRALFEELCELSGDARAARLEAIAREDPGLRGRLDQLLAADSEDDAFLEPAWSASEALGVRKGAEPTGLEGRDVGGFRILRVLAEGGMGTVYEAQQTHPDRRVALKTLRSGLVSEPARQRFRYEGELLARLRHPNIAQVLGAGVLELVGSSDLPWMALELVEDARPLTALASDPAVPVARRLRLFLTTCDALHHAHLRGVLHRDVKGANVLIDGEGHVKVIDFGIARPLDGPGLDVTRSGEMVGTLGAMAPEQIDERFGDVDARTDVYALGVLLLELITGRTPYDLREKSLGEAARAIVEADPLLPSRVDAKLPRELDWIVGRALAKRPEERYASVSELAADVERLLDDEPVQAGPPSTMYRLRKYYRRHRLAVVAAIGALAALVAGLVGTSIGLVQAREAAVLARASEEDARESELESRTARAAAERAANEARAAERQARTAEQEARLEALLAGELFAFFQDGLASPDPGRRGRELTMLDFLRRTSETIGERFGERPLVAGLLDRTIGRSLFGLGESSEAREHLERAARLLEAIDDPDQRPQARRELAEALGDLSVVLVTAGDPAGAEVLLDRALVALEEADELTDLRVAQIEAKRARSRLELGQVEDAERLAREAIAVLPPGDDEALGAASILAGALRASGRRAEAIEVLQAARDAVDEGSDTRLWLYLTNNLAASLQESGREAEAMAVLEDFLPEQEALFGPGHPDVVATKSNLGALFFFQGRPAEALPLWREALEGLSAELPPEHPVLQALRGNLAVATIDHGDPAEGEELLRGLHAVRREQYGADDERTLLTQYEWGRALSRLERFGEALPLVEDMVERIERALGTRHATLPLAEYLRGQVLEGLDREDEALEQFERLLFDLRDGRRDRTHVDRAELEQEIDAILAAGSG